MKALAASSPRAWRSAGVDAPPPGGAAFGSAAAAGAAAPAASAAAKRRDVRTGYRRMRGPLGSELDDALAGQRLVLLVVLLVRLVIRLFTRLLRGPIEPERAVKVTAL